MNQSTREAFIVVMNEMIKYASYKIGGIKRKQNISDFDRECRIKSENKFKENCLKVIEQLEKGRNRLPITFFRKDQHGKETLKYNLKVILGENHPEIENIINIVYNI